MKPQLLLPALLTASASASPLNQTWDYIIVGGGASGIPLADRLSESGKSVLLIERGFASSGRWGGTWKPSWLQDTNLTRFDVPALYQFIWTNLTDNSGIICPDVSTPASCVLGGGTAINAGQFYLPTPMDWDLTDMPPAWHSQHMRSATARALSRLPWTDTPSMDGESYLTNGSRITISLLTNSSLPHAYKLIRANDHPETRDHVLSLAEYFFQSGERGGPMATYLVSASKRRNFHLQLNTTVARVLRTGDHANGVQVGPTYPGGLNGTIKLTPKMGRVILSAGVFNTAKILFRSAIGPREQLHIVQNSTDGPLMLDEKHWIERPVGRNLDDAPSVYLAVSGFALDTYDWESLWDKPPAADVQRYLHNRSGPLAEIQPSLGPVFWDEIRGEDSRTRVVQWTTNSGVLNGQGILAFAANLNRGHTSRGTGLEDYLRAAIATQPLLTSNHWVGSTRMGASCEEEGDAVVDAGTRVCGMANLHVVDAGIVNGVSTANPQGVFITAAERAAAIILEMDE
ncbi:GMC oxidoreductase [Trematosphaeria pertusa]|uniref:GMC oxidoreductase n=1 Tax=Trematosphaeria pertusa TaxID=390896 RepID=A0A6A6IE72_9PLEO|nr:GMC oxidoreductase [Trematosphaeria pertusa]KAF2248507.1 GMC oxidoreductase [Trematosphaeria pertusa]